MNQWAGHTPLQNELSLERTHSECLRGAAVALGALTMLRKYGDRDDPGMGELTSSRQYAQSLLLFLAVVGQRFAVRLWPLLAAADHSAEDHKSTRVSDEPTKTAFRLLTSHARNPFRGLAERWKFYGSLRRVPGDEINLRARRREEKPSRLSLVAQLDLLQGLHTIANGGASSGADGRQDNCSAPSGKKSTNKTSKRTSKGSNSSDKMGPIVYEDGVFEPMRADYDLHSLEPRKSFAREIAIDQAQWAALKVFVERRSRRAKAGSAGPSRGGSSSSKKPPQTDAENNGAERTIMSESEKTILKAARVVPRAVALFEEVVNVVRALTTRDTDEQFPSPSLFEQVYVFPLDDPRRLLFRPTRLLSTTARALRPPRGKQDVDGATQRDEDATVLDFAERCLSVLQDFADVWASFQAITKNLKEMPRPDVVEENPLQSVFVELEAERNQARTVTAKDLLAWRKKVANIIASTSSRQADRRIVRNPLDWLHDLTKEKMHLEMDTLLPIRELLQQDIDTATGEVRTTPVEIVGEVGHEVGSEIRL